MNRITGRLNRRLHDRLSAMGLTFQHWRVLASLSARDRPTIAEIAEYSVIPHSTLSRLLTRMEREGLVRRAGAHEDRRVARIILTAKGARAFRLIVPHAVGIREQALAGFDKSETELLRGMLLRMFSNISDVSNQGSRNSGYSIQSRA
jgi:DNA-binding MarR family transcriptional regulator